MNTQQLTSSGVREEKCMQSIFNISTNEEQEI